jgi:inner membrane protein
MIWSSHTLISGTATSLILGTNNPSILLIGAVAGLLPDVDISISPAGRMFPWISHYLERRFSHRSCTHSFVASSFVAFVSYFLAYILGSQYLVFAHALCIGYFFGWFADVFTRAGVEMFWPCSMRWVCPQNRNLRLRTGSQVEYAVLAILIGIAFAVFNINTNGGLLNQFNRLIASPSGVEQIYNQSGATHLITARIQGVRASDRTKVMENFLLIQVSGQGFIVQSNSGQIYKAGTEPDCQIITEKITADVGQLAMTSIQSMTLEDDEIQEKLAPLSDAKSMVFITGDITVDDPDGVTFANDAYQFPFIRKTETSIKLEVAPLQQVLEKIGDQFATGQILIRKIINNG